VAEVWLADPPAGPDPRTLAVDVERTVSVPPPSGDRSPGKALRVGGYPFTYVNLWTWFWTAPDTWRSRSATASAGGLSVSVTVTPTALVFDPGDGSAPASCAGPGRPWRASDGDAQPTEGGCAFRYTAATTAPVTSTQAIRWSVTWRASNGESGTLRDLITSRSQQLRVLQIESVLTP
jgi:hypothetical protein